ncbi:hypothetical protein CLOM_g24107 [Closterium sp. NIES-68]|nr:hypothetical protein CLOM_g24107 [Closterium sp. NIES-68]
MGERAAAAVTSLRRSSRGKEEQERREEEGRRGRERWWCELEWDDLIGRIEAEIEKPQASSCVDGESSSIARQDSQIVSSSEGAITPSDSGALKRDPGKGKARRVVQRKRPANSTSKFRGVTHPAARGGGPHMGGGAAGVSGGI